MFGFRKLKKKHLFILFNKNVATFAGFESLLFFKADGTVVLLSFRHIRCKFWQLDTTKRLRLNVSSASIKGESALNRSQNIQKHSNNSFLKRHRQFKMTVGLPEGLLVYNNKTFFTIRSILHLSCDQNQIIIQ